MSSYQPTDTRAALREGSSKVRGVADWDWITWLALSVTSLMFLAVLAGAAYGLWKLVDVITLRGNLDRPIVKLVLSVLLLVGAIILVAIKKSPLQPLYGLAEVAVGLAANWHSLGGLAKELAKAGTQDPSGSQFTRLAVLGGGLYLIGRGVANVAEGIERWASMEPTTKDEADREQASGS